MTRWAGRPALRRRLRRLRRPSLLGVLGRTTPHSDAWGFDRGTPIDRHYIERFLASHADDIRGRVLEVLDNSYALRFGTAVDHCDVVDIDPANARATFHADLAAADGIPSESFDCFILTQTIHLIYDIEAVVRHAYRILRPGGVLLATVPTVSRLHGADPAGDDYWRFTTSAGRRLFGDVFGQGRVEVVAHGNVLAGMAFLTGLAAQEVPRGRLDRNDPRFPVLVTVRASRE